MMNNQSVSKYVMLAEACYADFNDENSKLKSLDDMRKALVKSRFAKETTNKQIDILFKDWTVKAQWTDRSDYWDTDETSFSATLFQKNGANGEKDENGEYVLAFKGSKEPKDFVIADAGDIALDGFALKQSIDLINFRQQLLGEKGETYKVLSLQKDGNLSYMNYALTAGDAIQDLTSEQQEEYDRLLKEALDSGQYVKDGDDIFLMHWVNSDEYYKAGDERITGKGLSWDKITITGHSLGGNLAAIYSTWFANEVENTVTVNGAGFHQSVLNGTNNNFNYIYCTAIKR